MMFLLNSSGTPKGIDLDEIKERLGKLEGVKAIHDLHVWSLTVGTPALSAHLDIGMLEIFSDRIKHDPLYWFSRKNSLKLMDPSIVNKVTGSLV